MKQASLCPCGAGGRGAVKPALAWGLQDPGIRGRPAGPLGAQVRILPALQPFAPSQLLTRPFPTVPSC